MRFIRQNIILRDHSKTLLTLMGEGDGSFSEGTQISPFIWESGAQISPIFQGGAQISLNNNYQKTKIAQIRP